MTLNSVIAVYFWVISLNSVAFGAYYVKAVEDTPIHSESEM